MIPAVISRPPLDDQDKIVKNAKSVLQSVQNALTTNVDNKSAQEFLQDINLDLKTYMDAL